MPPTAKGTVRQGSSSSGPACGVELSSPDAITVNGSTDDLYVLDQTDPARIVELLP